MTLGYPGIGTKEHGFGVKRSKVKVRVRVMVRLDCVGSNSI